MTELESKLDWYVDRLKDLYLREHTDDIFSASSRIGVPSCTLVGDNITDTIVSLCSVRATKESDIITQEAEEFRSGDKYWGIVTLEVVEGALSIEDVWFRSGLEVENRRVSIDYRVNRAVKRGMRPRGELKQGHTAYAVYIVSEDSDDVSWYTDEMSHSVTIE